ncbi:hypothetical protein D3C81_1601910 [compost metagenome]
MAYRGQSARVKYSKEDRLWVGHLCTTPYIVGFHARSRRLLPAAFKEAVDDYLEIAKETGVPNPDFARPLWERVHPRTPAKPVPYTEPPSSRACPLPQVHHSP